MRRHRGFEPVHRPDVLAREDGHARSSARRLSSFRVDSCVLSVPSRGSVTCFRSGSTRMVPVVNRTDGMDFRLDLKRGKPTRGLFARPATTSMLTSEQPADERGDRPARFAVVLHGSGTGDAERGEQGDHGDGQ